MCSEGEEQKKPLQRRIGTLSSQECLRKITALGKGLRVSIESIVCFLWTYSASSQCDVALGTTVEVVTENINPATYIKH